MKFPCQREALVHWAFVAGAALGVAALIYGLAIIPLQRRERALGAQAAELRARIATTRQSLQEIKQQEQAAAATRGSLRQMQRNLPTGSVLAWLPSRMKQHFDRAGVPGAVARLNTARDEPGIVGYQRTYWAVDLPLGATNHTVSHALLAVASLEEVEPIVKVLDLAIRRDDESGSGTVVINVTALVEREAAL